MISRFMFVVVLFCSLLAFSQQPNQPPPPPPPPGEGHPPGGMNPKGPPMWNADSCRKEEPKLRKSADRCMKIKKEDQRKMCFDRVSDGFPPGFEEGCRGMLEMVRKDFRGHEGQPHAEGMKPADNKEFWTPERCAKEIPRLRKKADACLAVRNYDKRNACFEKMGEGLPPGFDEACKGVVEPMKQEYMDKEKRRYPNQPSAVGGHGGGGDHAGPQPGQPPREKMGPPKDCGKTAQEMKKRGMECLKHADSAKRKECCDKVGESASQFENQCGEQINQVHAEVVAKEAEKYKDEIVCQ